MIKYKNLIIESGNSLFRKKSQHESQVSKLMLTREQLPVYSVRNQIIKAIEENPTIILMSETGSGKTTQIPQFIFKSILVRSEKNKSLCITQPRRVAAISLATRVAQELGTELGYLVGYSVRFEDRSCEKTKIKFMTDGMLLRETLKDPNLTKYRVIILDEAHERSIQTDILFTLVKEMQQRRANSDNPLKIVIMSATMNVDKFSDFFGRAPVYFLEGRHHPIKIYNSIKEQNDYQHAALVTVFQIHQNEPEGDILVFCTGQEEIDAMVRTTHQTAHDLPEGNKKLLPLPLYSALPTELQMRVFNPTEKDTRKVIFSTNIAETSITIPGVKYVIDSGKVKCKVFKPTVGIEVLRIENISKAQAKQRAGRAGRESSGNCYRLYTKEEQDKFSDFAKPEIIRTSLESILLQLNALNVKNFTKFDFIDRPNIESIKKSASILENLNATKKIKENEYELTELGKQMTTFPLDPKLSRILIESSNLGCMEEVLTILSLLYVDTVFYVPVHKREHATKIIDKFTSSEGDHITLLNVYRAFKSVNGKNNRAWCQENFINQRNLKMALEVRKQLNDLCEQAQLIKSSCGNDTERIRKCLVYGLFMNVAQRKKEGYYEVEQTNEKVYIHPSSCLNNLKPDYVVYTEIIQTTKCYIRQLSVIDRRWLDNVRHVTGVWTNDISKNVASKDDKITEDKNNNEIKIQSEHEAKSNETPDYAKMS